MVFDFVYLEVTVFTLVTCSVMVLVFVVSTMGVVVADSVRVGVYYIR